MTTIDPIERQSDVNIYNRTGKKILSVSIVHKYSDDYRDKFEYNEIMDNDTFSEKSMTVHYRTGIFESGVDWWLVSWTTEDGLTYITNPSNARGVFDYLEGKAKPILNAISGFSLGAIFTFPEPTTKVLAAAAFVTSIIADTFVNDESTAGFKKHTLTEEDEKGEDDEIPNTILITKDKVWFRSKSGNSQVYFTGIVHTNKPEDDS
ncbi:hypothetical protein [Xenorhabdus bovienii]|uniref:hypothetical protein n=1 Tax=Xenorhabdus bovienii TaxID=40576 RepID=UPI00237CA2AB|nr:hypothetical protein [Xenorhabdus bovienii]MDE1482870.1 hypothetical protein [Xenorhabdus bovienii]MDE9426956.1 hypothetical protein [Xenorhabdus bovienii]MDE9431716.1 hypothetical protein [Xenorhabdus bovienii]MDE9464813.1 hypothetical protein [Xenorhabdus bovienii]MDE9489441.1 hypothetical protein [Xenorhabdus bovienii]